MDSFGGRIREKMKTTSQIMKKFLEWGTPVLAFVVFLGLWSQVASRVHVSFGALPGPKDVWVEASHLVDGYKLEQQKKKEFYLKQAQKKQEFLKQMSRVK